MNKQRSLCFGDMHVIVINGHQFLTLNGERVSKSRQGEDVRDVRHGIGVLAALPHHPKSVLFLCFWNTQENDLLFLMGHISNGEHSLRQNCVPQREFCVLILVFELNFVIVYLLALNKLYQISLSLLVKLLIYF